MLVPFVKVVFEGPSGEYYARLKSVVSSRMTGCARLVFSDFEGTIFYREGVAVTALQESGMWMALGPEMIAPLENKAIATTGTMAIYELTPAMLSLFEGRKIGTTIDTELGDLVNPGMLLDNLRNAASTCILKFRGQAWTGYAFLASGKIAGASYISENDRHYGDKAIDSIKKATGKASAAIYFLEGGAPIAEALPPEPARPVKEKPIEVQAPAPAPTPVPAPVPAAPAEAREAPRQTELKVATGSTANLLHESRIATLETLETRKIAWMDAATLAALKLKEGGSATLVLPGGETEKVTVGLAEVLPGTPAGILILPKKLRRRLSIEPGSTVVVRP
ncbi:AbrB/MazE/SpoVT family DNA-binding domain-containing protein [Methanocella arvoryzae]|uniref:Uncharacterized protein n=1 Tax=Methanocella arvoryzae (strain DSM 22066 / NBRC 105507 / MRE50) TaxID=351160 RepID=Q0W767_METAR|nr:AbrB/MazE/SpoVT family DNA-binding domain-containing protein [Methanocella arvoryzae]CAJ35776.1 hypothetical protein RCIX316 [Methanocella arvoryzae MRE50]